MVSLGCTDFILCYEKLVPVSQYLSGSINVYPFVFNSSNTCKLLTLTFNSLYCIFQEKVMKCVKEIKDVKDFNAKESSLSIKHEQLAEKRLKKKS